MAAVSTYDSEVSALATTMAKTGCVWFIGAGFSLPSGLPGVTQLSLTLLKNAVLGTAPPAQRLARYEQIKLTLLGRSACDKIGLKEQSNEAGMRMEIEWIETEATAEANRGPKRPQWLLDLLNLGRLAEVVHRTASRSKPGDDDMELAACLGLDDPKAWEKEPSFAHHLLALLVMEGLIPQMITLNYDDQIERACRQVEVALHPVRDRVEYRQGPGGRWEGQPALFKIHGCRNGYLEALAAFKSDPGNDERRSTLVESCQAIVVTDRQLQHWRDSRWAWARDLFQDLLRWRPFMFIGFSASDLVLQATLNALAEEIGKSKCEIFVAPSLSFPFYQFLSRMNPSFDSAHPTGVLEAYGQKLLPDLYPKAIAAHFAQCLENGTEPNWLQAIAADRHSVAAHVNMADAYAAATRLLTEAARQVAAEDVRTSAPRDPDKSLLPEQFIRASTVRRLLHDLLYPAPRQGYMPLRLHIEEYRKIAQVLAVMLAVTYPDKLTMDQLSCKVEHETDNVIVEIQDPAGAHELRRVVLVPENWRKEPETWLKTWTRSYFEQRWKKGLLDEGTHTLIHSHWLNQAEMETAVDAVDWDDYRGSYSVEIFTIGGHYQSKRGKLVV